MCQKKTYNSQNESKSGIYVITTGGGKIQAIYLAPQNGGEISENDLKSHPEVLEVSDFQTLDSYLSKYIIPVWIDKSAIGLLPQGYFTQYPQKFYPIIVIGYSNALYTMREKLNLIIFGPYVDWGKQTLEPGFSVWLIRTYGDNGISSTMKGYQEEIDVSHILEVSNELLKECLGTLEYKNTEYGFSFYLPLTWQGYSIVESSWAGFDSQGNLVEKGPIISIRHPLWTKENPRQDIPIMVFTIE